jgi:hypothetical protein
MNGFFNRLWNVLLLPAGFYKRLNDKKTTLYIGILIVGLFDLFLPDFLSLYKQLFTGKSSGDMNNNVLIAALAVIVLGAVDVIFFSLPLYDVFRFLKKREGTPHEATPVKAMKVYIVSNLMLSPVATVINYVFFRNLSESSPAMLTSFYLIFFYVILIWSSAIVTRGFNTLFDFSPVFRRLTFIVIFTWTFILGMVFQLQIMNWIFKLFK